MKVLFFIFLIQFLFCGLSWASPYKVIVDPGHGGEDHGAVNGHYKEAHIALQVSKRLHRLINKQSNLKSYLTRSSDQTLTLPQRVAKANRINADLFVSIHINSSPNKRARGGEVYIRNELEADEERIFLAQFENGSEEVNPKAAKSQFVHQVESHEVLGILENVNETYSLKLASLIAKDILKDWGGKKRLYHNRIHQAPFYVVKHTQMPSILIELGFISNSSEAKKLSNGQYQEKLALGILKGINGYFRRLSTDTSSKLYSKK